jgi:hypothetical protein
MSNERKDFTNNFDEYENKRFNLGIEKLKTLFSKENKDIIDKKISEQLIDVKTIDDSANKVKGMVYANKTDDIGKLRIYYIKHQGDRVAYSWHMMLHELTHFIGKPDMETIDKEMYSVSDKMEVGGTKIWDLTTNSEYGNFFNECGADLISEMAMTTLPECKETNPRINSVDDIIYCNERYEKTDYDSLSTIARLMVVAMDNNFSDQSYNKMLNNGIGIIGSEVKMINQETGEVLDTVPTNDYLYAMFGHGKHLENQFDRYSIDGSYREMCTFLDREIKAIQIGEKNRNIDKSELKEPLLKMKDMVNNKAYILQSNKCISQKQKDAYIKRFDFVFNQALQEYGIVLTSEDMEKTTESMNKTMQEENLKIGPTVSNYPKSYGDER